MTDAALPLAALPDPDRRPEFYRSVPAKRAMAWVIDVTIIAVAAVLVLPFTAFTGLLFFPLLMMMIGFVYRWTTLASGSATWGMRVMAIEIRDHEGRRLSPGTALAHTAGYTFSVVTAPLQLLSIGAMALTPRGQGLTDLVLGTTALNRAA